MNVASIPYNYRQWQEEARNEIEFALSESKKDFMHVVMNCVSSVGSGKTTVIWDTIATVAKRNGGKNVFLCFFPTISLTNQQTTEVYRNLFNYYPWMTTSNTKIVKVHCNSSEKNLYKNILNNLDNGWTNIVFMVCDASLFGNDKKKGVFKEWVKTFHDFKSSGWNLALAYGDEAHNYSNQTEKLLGVVEVCEDYDNCKKSGDYSENNLMNMFDGLILLSGTPAEYQKKMDKWTKHFRGTFGVSFGKSVELGYIMSPTLNLVKGSSHDLASGIVNVIEREMNDKFNEFQRGLINAGGIEEATYSELIVRDYFQKIGCKVHTIVVHSGKKVDKLESDLDYLGNHWKKGQSPTLESSIDGVAANKWICDHGITVIDEDKNEVTPDIKEFINNLDTHGNKWFGDDAPVVVFQIDMLSEGINVKSFNFMLTTTKAYKRAVQQIGRIVRLFLVSDGGYYDKKRANCYIFFENKSELAQLFCDLAKEGIDMTCSSTQVGDELDVKTIPGTTVSPQEQKVISRPSSAWTPITKMEIEEICSNVFKQQNKIDTVKKWCASGKFFGFLSNIAKYPGFKTLVEYSTKKIIKVSSTYNPSTKNGKGGKQGKGGNKGKKTTNPSQKSTMDINDVNKWFFTRGVEQINNNKLVVESIKMKDYSGTLLMMYGLDFASWVSSNIQNSEIETMISDMVESSNYRRNV